MRIGFDGGCLANRRGFGRFARQTLRALAEAGSPHEIVVLLDRPSAESVELPPGVQAVLVDVREAPSIAASATGRRRIGDLVAMGRAAASARLDLIYFPASYSFFPVWNVPRVVVTMHDTLAFKLPNLVFPTHRGRFAWTVKEHAAARWADAVVTVSEASRHDLIHHFRLDPGRVRVIPEGTETVFRPIPPGPESVAVLHKYGIPWAEPFLLYVGGLSPHKNLPRLIEAVGRGAVRDFNLVLVGDHGDVFYTHVPELRRHARRWGMVRRLFLTGFVPDAELAHLYSRAYALVQPSLMEGFGLPPLEAMACGTPVLCSHAGSLPEVVGPAGVYFDPESLVEMDHAIHGLLADRETRDRLAGLALERSRLFTWEAAARGLLEVFEGLAPARKRRPA